MSRESAAPMRAAGAPDVGLSLLRRAGPERFRKVLITGIGRSGTSAVAAIFDCLGFHLGDEPVVHLHEDLALRRLLLQGHADPLARALQDWSTRHAAVAWKDPKIYAAATSSFTQQLGDDWLIIGVLRDPLAIAQRRAVSDGTELLPTAHSVARFQMKLLAFLQAVPQTVGLVSYERFIVDPQSMLQMLLTVVDAPIPPTSVSQLCTEVLSQRALYRSHTTLENQDRNAP